MSPTTNIAPSVCEACDNTVGLSQFMSMWLCVDCKSKEIELQQKAAIEADARVAESRAASNQAIEIQKQIIPESEIQVVSDIYNAHTQSIKELERKINDNPEIPVEQKALALATELHSLYSNLAHVVFDARQILIDAGNQQRAIQTYMNTLQNKLRAEEREKLKLQDINYTPDSIKSPKVKKHSDTVRKPKKTIGMKEAKEVAAKYGVPVEILRSRLVRKSDETVEEAAQAIAKKMGGSLN